KLELIGAFVAVALSEAASHEAGIQKALNTAGLMFNAGYVNSFIVLSDNNGSVQKRTKNAGRINSNMSLSPNSMRVFAHGANSIAKAVKDIYGMRTVFHHHCGGFIETP